MRLRRPSTPLSRSRVRKSAGAYRRELRDEMIDAYGGACTCCGVAIAQFLTLEHRNLDGAAHRAAVGRNAQAQLVDLKRRGWPTDGYTLLCFNCNLASYHHGSCPHTWPNGVKPCDPLRDESSDESSQHDGAIVYSSAPCAVSG